MYFKNQLFQYKHLTPKFLPKRKQLLLKRVIFNF